MNLNFPKVKFRQVVVSVEKKGKVKFVTRPATTLAELIESHATSIAALSTVDKQTIINDLTDVITAYRVG